MIETVTSVPIVRTLIVLAIIVTISAIVAVRTRPVIVCALVVLME